MVRGLHGGGVRFVAERTSRELVPFDAARERLTFLEPSGRGAVVLSADGADGALTLSFDETALTTLRVERGGETMSDDPEDEGPADPRLYVPILAAAGDVEPHEDTTLQAFADALGDQGDAAPGGLRPLHTYFGQFVGHDVSHMRGAAPVLNHRSSAFDLDSVFEVADPDTDPAASVCLAFPEGLLACVGPVAGGGAFADLPRGPGGVPRGVDRRNDNNPSLAQTTLLIHRFLRRLWAALGAPDRETLRCEAARHLQSILVHDWLPAVCGPDLVAKILRDGRKLVAPGPAATAPAVFHVPTEFAAACFRFGHGMVAARYPWNAEQGRPFTSQLLKHTHFGPSLKDGRLARDWPVDWARFDGPEAAAAPIDTRLSGALRSLNAELLDPDGGAPGAGGPLPFDLAEVTLMRGRELGLPSAQELLAHAEAQGCPSATLAAGEPIFPPAHPVAQALTPAQRDELERATPLWLYTLREAEIGGGGHLGPLAGRVVAETLLTAVAAADGNVLASPGFDVAAGLPGAGSGRFTLNDLVAAGAA